MTRTWPKESSSWLGPTRAPSGAASASSMRCARRCGVLPRGPGRLRHRSGQLGCAGGLQHRPDPRARPGAVAVEDRLGAAQGWPPTQHRAPGRGDPGALRDEQLEAPELITKAHGLITRSALALIVTFNAQIAELEAALSEHFEQHPDAKVVLSLPGLGTVLGARVLGEFGDDRTRFSGPKSRKNYAGTSPVTKASGHSRGRPGPFRPQPPPRRRLRPVGLLRAHHITGRPELLRPATSPRQDPSSGPPTAGQPLGRDPPHLPGARRALRRTGRLAGGF